MNVKMNSIVWIDGEQTTYELLERFDYLANHDARRALGGRLGDSYSEEMSEVQFDMIRKYLALHNIPVALAENLVYGYDWTDEEIEMISAELRSTNTISEVFVWTY